MSHIVYIGFGSNLDNPLSQVKSAILELHTLKNIIVDAVSSIYKSKPLEIKGDDANTDSGMDVKQADYINAVARVKTSYTPNELLDELQALELKHKRVKDYRWGPRSLDLDILLYDDLILETERLMIPHVELINRDFVLYPLNDINPELEIPRYGKLELLLENFTKDNLTLIENPLDVQGMP